MEEKDENPEERHLLESQRKNKIDCSNCNEESIQTSPKWNYKTFLRILAIIWVIVFAILVLVLHKQLEIEMKLYITWMKNNQFIGCLAMIVIFVVGCNCCFPCFVPPFFSFVFYISIKIALF